MEKNLLHEKSLIFFEKSFVNLKKTLTFAVATEKESLRAGDNMRLSMRK